MACSKHEERGKEARRRADVKPEPEPAPEPEEEEEEEKEKAALLVMYHKVGSSQTCDECDSRRRAEALALVPL